MWASPFMPPPPKTRVNLVFSITKGSACFERCSPGKVEESPARAPLGREAVHDRRRFSSDPCESRARIPAHPASHRVSVDRGYGLFEQRLYRPSAGTHPPLT